MIIDCHLHLNNYTKRAVPTEEMVRQLHVRMKRYGVDHGIVLSSYLVNEKRPAVETLIELCRPFDDLSVVEGVLFEDGRPQLDGTRERLQRGEIVGLKMYPGYLYFYPNDPACDPVYDLAMEHDVPVMFHSGDTYAKGGKVKYSHPLVLDDVAVDHPDLKIIICHLGNPWFRDTAEMVYKNENVYADISGLVLEGFEWGLEKWVAEEVKDIIEYAGEPEYLLYGTDWPLVRMKPYLTFVETLGLSKRVREQILWKNANELFKLGLKAGADRGPKAKGKGAREGKVHGTGRAPTRASARGNARTSRGARQRGRS